MRRSRRAVLALLVLLTAGVVSCDVLPRLSIPRREPVYAPPVFGPDDSTFTDAQLLAAVYSSYLYPPGFYEEPWETVAPYYVNTLSIAPRGAQPPDWRELATDDPAQARAWAESTIVHSSYPFVLDTATIATDRYFEIPPAQGQRGVPMRAHRLAYLDRSGLDRLRPDSLQGRLNARPIDAASTRAVCEYLWYLGHRRIAGEKALSSFGRTGADGCEHVVFGTRLVVGDWGMYDTITLIRHDYRVSAATGDIVLHEYRLRSIRGARH